MAASHIPTPRDGQSTGGHNQPCRAWGRELLLPSSGNEQGGLGLDAYLQSGSCQQPGHPAILHNLHLRQAAPARSSRLLQGDPRCLLLLLPELFSSVSTIRKKKQKTKPTRVSYLRSWHQPSSQNNEVGSIGAATSSSRVTGGHKARIKGQPFISAPDGPAAEMQEGGWDNRGKAGSS